MQFSQKFESISPSPTLTIDSKFKEMKALGYNVVGFGAGEPDYDTPNHIKQAAINAILNGKTKYTPASGTMELKKAICDKFQKDNSLSYTPANIVVSNGAKHSLINAFGAILNPGDEVIVPAPFWVSYPEMIKYNDGVPVILYTTEEKGFKFTAEELEKAITPKTKALVLNSPSNPTGMVYSEEELKTIADVCLKYNLYIISDEIYEHLVYGSAKHVSIASFGEEIKDRTIIVNGLSKTYAMTGWRIGFTASNEKIAKLMANVQSHSTSNPNSIAQEAAVAALTGPTDELKEMISQFDKRRQYMYERFTKMPYVSVLEPEGAFYVFVDVSEVVKKSYKGKVVGDAAEMARILIDDYNVAVVPCADFGFDDHIRLSYAISVEQIDKGVTRIEQFLGELN